jgi:low temperature requirement protein LtrA
MLLWLASIFVPAPERYYVIVLALIVDLATPRSAARWMGLFPLNNTHLPERFGLFTTIVLGEAIFGIVMGYVDGTPGLETGLTAAFGFLIVFAFWYVYFNSLEGTGINQRLPARTVWIYSHLPLLMSLAAIAVGVKFAVISAGQPFDSAHRWLLCGSFALSYALLGVLHRNATGHTCPVFLVRKSQLRSAAAIAGLLLATLGAALPGIAVTGLLALFGIAQAALEIAALHRYDRMLELNAPET